MKLQEGEIKSAKISECGNYRFHLTRTWEANNKLVCFIGLNPSTADHERDDPTIRRCRNFAKSWGYGGMVMLNLFAWRATSPKDMMNANDPIHFQNDAYIEKISAYAGIVVACWGNHGVFLNRGPRIKNKMTNLYYLKLTKAGYPAHPLYLKKDLEPVHWG